MRLALTKGKLIAIGVAIVLALLGKFVWTQWHGDERGESFVSGNGRIEATEIDIASKFAGRVSDVMVREGDFVKTGQTVARMRIDTLQAQYDETFASQGEALHAIAAAQAQVIQRQSDVAAQRAVVEQRQAELEAIEKRFVRSETLAKVGATSQQSLDDDRAQTRSAAAAVVAARAQVVALEAAVKAAEAQKTGAESRLAAVKASVTRVSADIADNELKAPRDGRVQFRLAQPGEVIGAGGRVLSLVDLSDVYMTFFLPERAAGRVAIGSEVRIVLDIAPQYAIPARISFVSSTAQFTPKTVETASERQKLMFRVRAQIPAKLLRNHVEEVKTGLPGIAWVKLDPAVPWPKELARAVAE